MTSIRGIQLSFVWLALALLPPCASAQQLLNGKRLSDAYIDATITEQMRVAEVPGLAVARIDDGVVTFVRAYGKRDLAQGLPLTTDTLMDGASLTKATFAYLVMQLVDERRIDLDQPIGSYFSKPLPEYARYRDLQDDPRWEQLTMRMLLSHTTGFANFRFFEPDRKLRFHRAPGERYGYSGEGIQLAQFVLEEGLGLNLGKEMQARIFDRFGMQRTSMTWRDDFAENFAEGYTLEGKHEPFNRRARTDAAGSMDTTIADWAPALFKEGHDEGTANYALCVSRRCILLMANSTRAELIFASLVERLFGKVPLPAAWEGYAEP